MTLTDTHTFEEGTDSAAVPTGSNGVVAVGGTTVYKTAAAQHGALGVDLGTDGATISYSAGSAGTVSFYGTIKTASTGSGSLFTVNNGSTILARIRANSTGTKFDVANQGSTVQATSTATYTVGQAYRCDSQWSYDGTNIAVVVRIFLGSNVEGYVPDDILAPAAFASVSAPNRIRVGPNAIGWAATADTVRLYDSTSAWPIPYTASPSLSMRPVRVANNNGSSLFGSAADMAAAMADESDTTGWQSGTAGTTSANFWLGPGVVPDSSILRIKNLLTQSGTGTFNVRLYEGNVLRKTWNAVTITTTATSRDLTIDATTIGNITDWTNLYMTLEYAA